MSSSQLFALVLAAAASGAHPAKANTAVKLPAQADASAPFTGMKWRLVGPFRGGRATGVAGVPGDPTTFYFGASGGGLWKTTDAGTTWKPLWDDFPEASQAVGAVAVAPSDAKTLYVGTGEANIRGNVIMGNGVYKSVDAGKTWTSAGLKDTQVVGRIAVDPKDANTVYVAALGTPFAENAARGVFKSTDAGKTWKKVLYVDARTGAVDVKIDPTDPKVLWAGMWQVHRKPWIMESGGPGSGLYRSGDGGETWSKVSGGGLPDGIWGRVNVAPTSDPKRIYAMVEAKKGGLYRSDDGGRTWALVTDKNDYRQRAWYFNTVFADPKSPDTVYVLNTGLYRSTDAGKTFKALHPRHGDNHELWIDPTDPRHMINGNDGGANVSLDNGDTWSTEQNQPTAQFYHVATDDQFPFRLYGDQQDNSSVSIATASRSGSIGEADFEEVGGGESGFIVPDPTDPNIVYGGGYDAQITRHDVRTGNEQEITPWPRNIMGWAPKDQKYRFQWTAPIMVSRHDPHALYFGANVLFKSLDQGRSWTIVSPDLTRDDKSKQEASGGPLTKDNTSVETYDTIFALAESPRDGNEIWAGSDDGLIHLTRDGGKSWSDVTPKAMPEWATVQTIEVDGRHPGKAYVTADRHRLDDPRPYVFRTDDYGASWTEITQGIAADAYAHAVRVDPAREGLLYAGTERGVYVSYDDGGHWAPLQLNLPRSPAQDLAVHGDSLAVATHGRAFWMIDDLAPIRQWDDAITAEKVHLFTPQNAQRTTFGGRGGGLETGANPPAGAVIDYWLGAGVGTARPTPEEEKAKAEADKKKSEAEKKAEAAKPDPYEKRLKIEILDEQGQVVRTFPDPEDKKPEDKLEARPGKSAKAAGAAEAKAKPDTAKEATEAESEDEEVRGPPKPKLTHFAGLNSFVWDLRYSGATPIPHSPLWAGSTAGPKALPGRYQVRLTVDGKSQVQPLVIDPDPRKLASPADLRRQFELHRQINDELTQVHKAVLEIRAARARIKAKARTDAEKAKAEAVDAKMTAIEEALIQPRARASEDALNYPIRLNNMIAALGSLVGSGDFAPTKQDEEMFVELKGEADAQLAAWRALKEGEVRAAGG